MVEMFTHTMLKNVPCTAKPAVYYKSATTIDCTKFPYFFKIISIRSSDAMFSTCQIVINNE